MSGRDLRTYSYRLPLWVRLFFLGIASLLWLGTRGFVDDSFNESVAARNWANLILSGVFLYVLLAPYRNNKILLSAEQVTIPSLHIPWLRPNVIALEDIRATSIIVEKKHGSESLVLETPEDKFKIQASYCGRDFELFVSSPESFRVLVDDIEEAIRNRRRPA